MDRDKLNATFDQTVANLRAQVVPKTVDVKHTRLWRAADKDGEAVFHMLVTDSQDNVYPLRFTTANVRGEHQRNEQRKVKVPTGNSLLPPNMGQSVLNAPVTFSIN
jgi:endonuclease/exonuclease/phosphatase (EEP) superfamily protein YafD